VCGSVDSEKSCFSVVSLAAAEEGEEVVGGGGEGEERRGVRSKSAAESTAPTAPSRSKADMSMNEARTSASSMMPSKQEEI